MATAAQQISQIYVGYFNRAPDPAGLQYWINQLNNGMPLGEIADYFATEQETLDLYPYLREPDLNSVDDFINQIYGNLFNRPADAAGMTFWKAQLESGAVSEGEFIAAIANGATGEGRLVLDNKVSVGVYFATELSQNNVVWDANALDAAYQALAGVTLDPASVIDAKAEINYFIDNGAWPGTPGETFVLQAGNPGPYIGTAGNDTFQGVVGGANPTFETFDNIDGKGGVNTFQLVVAANTDLPIATTVSNIQNVQLLQATGVVQNLTTAAFGTAVEQVWQIGGATDIELSANGQTAGFRDVTIAGGGTGAVTAADGVTNASVGLDNAGVGSIVAFLGSNVKTVSVSGSVGGTGEFTVDTTAAAQIDVLNLAITSNSEVSVATTDVAIINGTASTGNLTIDATLLTLLESISTGSGNDKVTVDISGLVGTELAVNTGAGADTLAFTIDAGAHAVASFLTGGAGADSFQVTRLGGGNLVDVTTDAELNAALATITDFTASQDILDLTGAGLGSRIANNVVQQAIDAASATNLVEAVTAVASTTLLDQYAVFSFDGGTYVFADTGATGGTLEGGDMLIQLSGIAVSDLTSANFLV